jgi:hypothetical protein
VAERLLDERGALLPGHDDLAAELRDGWLARVGAGEVLAEVDDAAKPAPGPSAHRLGRASGAPE